MDAASAAAIAERILSEALGSRVSLRETRESRAGRVGRCAVDGVDRASVIVKVADNDQDRGLSTVWNEMAALTTLRSLAPELVPALLAAEPTIGLLVLEDLGDAPSLVEVLLDDDAVKARSALSATAASLGALHAATIGHAAEFDELRRSLGEVDAAADRVTLRGQHLGRQIDELPELLSAHDLPPLSRGASSELDAVLGELADLGELAEPGGFLALSSGDPCPGNDSVTPEGIRFFDFEVFRHALADAAHYRVPYPNCWCWRALPEDLVADLTAAYRAALARGCPEALDRSRFEGSLASTTAARFVWTLHRRLPNAASDELERQRIATAADGLASLAGEEESLPQLDAWVDAVRERLSARWRTPS